MVGISSLPDPPAMNQPAEVGCHGTPGARPVMDQRFRYRKSFRKSSPILLNSSGLSMFGTWAVPCIMAYVQSPKLQPCADASWLFMPSTMLLRRNHLLLKMHETVAEEC